MIVVAAGWKRCRRCQRFRLLREFNAKKRWPDGTIRWYQSYCKPCAQARNRELNGWGRRRRMSAAQKAKREIEKRREYEDRILADPERFAEARAKRRMDARLYRDRKRGAPPRPYPLRKTKCGVQVVERYRAPSQVETVPTAPLRAYIEQTYHGWTEREMCKRMNRGLPGAGARRVFEQERVELDFADRLLVCGLGRPDLLNVLYPVESR